MKISAKTGFAALAFSTMVGLQAFVIHQQSESNQALQSKVESLQNQVNSVNATNTKLLSKIEKIESDLELKPRQLLSMN